MGNRAVRLYGQRLSAGVRALAAVRQDSVLSCDMENCLCRHMAFLRRACNRQKMMCFGLFTATCIWPRLLNGL